ncbi:MAG: carbon-nitrogen hydrolase family protein [Peptostreptococcaceae bacterium]|nr:carbon-nitrogen hydrolase family protein [Peptostreptococcaceae bacterium]
MKLGLVQMNVTEDKNANIDKACEMIKKASIEGADMIVLPEMFNCPYDNKYFRKYAEDASGKTIKEMSKAAIENGVYIVAGSIPEIEEGNVFNTSFVLNPKGEIVAKHRKMHLFDIDIEGGIRFKESETLTPGRDVTVFETPFGIVGLAICYDMRFPELMRLMALKGAELIVVPAAFNRITGSAHWEMTAKARALDNQVYFAAVSPAVDWNASYHAYGHTIFVDPWGRVKQQLDDKEGLLICEMEKDLIEKVRNELPLMKHRRTDLYEIDFMGRR